MTFAPAWSQKGEFSPGDFDALRVENEIKLAVPMAIKAEVWSYLTSHYANEGLYLKAIDSGFHTKIAEDIFVDQYFDNEEGQLLAMKSGVRHRARKVLTDSTDKKNERELIQIKLNNIGQGTTSRGEIKYPVRHYDTIKEPLDEHVLLGMVKRKSRKELIERLKESKIDAMGLFPTIKLVQVRQRVYISDDTAAFATLTLDNVTAHFQNDSLQFLELEMELNEIRYTLADSLERLEMVKVNELMLEDLLKKFPSIKQDQTPKYNKAALAFNLQPGAFKGMSKPGGSSKGLLLWAGLGAVALIVVVLVVRRRRAKA